ncbi:hypothetical protein [Mycolicibacterium fluoranthenivorans]|uniref:Uncharacterized protein n=1 Tax=Mycolicibacterium fluoranthenivorans TaxID=258505 RepID=A0A7X5ZFE0_9MYCO|nr:hypothetical protein [Mycolicibacterium fluoranthenivorans]MCV7358461.1 hypothetical protein [Mycolicibacterium fluoranthenivorans]NIH98037.1 hypothetical protein [Mycolicibacterium fluoranthenivorans]
MSKFSDYVLLGDLMKPVAGIIPSGILATNEISATALNFTSGGRTAKEYRWGDWATNTDGSQTNLRRLDGSVSGGAGGSYDAANPYPFNTLGQKWIRHIRPTLSGPQTYGGVCNCATPRRFSAPGAGLSDEIFPHITELEFLFTGIAFSDVHMNLGGNNTAPNYAGNIEMFIEVDGDYYACQTTPMLVTSTSGYHTFHNVVFNNWQSETKIKLRFGTCGFTGIRTDTTSIIRPSPYQAPIGMETDSYGETSQALCTDNVNQFYLGTIYRQMWMLSTIPIVGFGQGSTGFFTNGAGYVTDDSVGTAVNTVFPVGNVTTTGLSRYFSGAGAGFSSRRGWMTDANTAIQGIGKPAFQNYVGEFFGGPLGTRPLALGVLGTWNDRSLLTNITDAQMYARIAENWDWVHSVDPYCQVVHFGVEPFDDGLFNNNTGVGSVGAPRDGDSGDVYTKAQRRAAQERDWVKFVNMFGPDAASRWWTGMGPALASAGGTRGVPTNSQQARLLSTVDSIHPDLPGTVYLGTKMILDGFADRPVHKDRVNGLR